MKKYFFYINFLIFTFLYAQTDNLYVPLNFQKAYQNNTRSEDGNPGNNYWQNHADYKIDVRFTPSDQLLKGHEEIHYYNNSPDTLHQLVLHLFPNILKKENYRDYPADINDLIDGVHIETIAVDGIKLDTSAHLKNLEYDETNCRLNLPAALYPGESLKLAIQWQYRVNMHSHYREGAVDSSSFFIAYFFPRIAVYDDIDGWNEFLYLGLSEFYNDFGDYEVSITVPQNYIVWATGEWQNPAAILQNKYLRRYQAAFQSEKVIHIIDSTEYQLNKVTKNQPFHTYHFTAEDVPDFAFALSDHYLWDAASIVVDSEKQKRVTIHTAYNKNSHDFKEVTNIAKKAILYMSENMPGMTFPYSKVTVFNGIANMEYPMMINNQSYPDINRTIRLTIHEILHAYLPFYCGINESKYGWMDEGFATFGHFLITSQFIGEEFAEFYFMPGYSDHKGHAMDLPMFAISDYLKRPVYHDNTYVKAASFYLVLRNYLGNELFLKGLQTFMQSWRSKHPTPYDFFYTFNNISSKNINWLIKPWFFEYGYVDLAIDQAQIEGDYLSAVIRMKGNYPAPVALEITFKNGQEKLIHKNVDIWENGNRVFKIKEVLDFDVEKIELIDLSRIDANLDNNLKIF